MNTGVKTIHLGIGDLVVSDKALIVDTILGSCVAVCLWDNLLAIGGMNHFMLPKSVDDAYTMEYIDKCAPQSIVRLISEMSRIGADLSRVNAKVFGGCRVVKVLSKYMDVGAENIKAARLILNSYGIPIIKEVTGKEYGLRVLFFTETGRVLIKRIECDNGIHNNKGRT